MSRRREGRIQSAIALHLCPNTLPISPHCWGQLTSIAKNKFECISWHWYISQSGFAGGWQKMDHWLLGHRRARTICQVARLLLFSGRNPWNRRNPWPHAPATLPGQRMYPGLWCYEEDHLQKPWDVCDPVIDQEIVCMTLRLFTGIIFVVCS